MASVVVHDHPPPYALATPMTYPVPTRSFPSVGLRKTTPSVTKVALRRVRSAGRTWTARPPSWASLRGITTQLSAAKVSAQLVPSGVPVYHQPSTST